MLIMLFMLLICITSVLYVVGIKFDNIKEGDKVMYYDDGLIVWDEVVQVCDGNIHTKWGKDFGYWNFIRGDFFQMNQDKYDER